MADGGDPIAVLAGTPRRVRRIAEGHAAEHLRRRPFTDKWTPNEILGHLADTEWAYGWRIRTVVGDEGATLAGFDQERWVERQGHNDRDPREHVEAFEALRRLNLALWRRLSPESGAALGRLLDRHAGHDRHHLDQLTRYLQALGAAAREGPRPARRRG